MDIGCDTSELLREGVIIHNLPTLLSIPAYSEGKKKQINPQTNQGLL